MLITNLVFTGCDQNTATTGARVYEKRGYDSANVVKAVPSGGYIIAGSTVKQGELYERDMHVMKVSENGDIEWFKTIGGNVDEFAHDICISKDGGYVIAGQYPYPRIVKLDTKGNLLWEYGKENPAIPYITELLHSIVETSDGGIIAIGIYQSGEVEARANILVIKLDARGNEVLRTRISDPSDMKEYFGQSIKAAKGGFIITGTLKSLKPGDNADNIKYNGFIMKISVDEVLKKVNVLWEKSFGTKEYDESLRSCAVSSDGSIIAAGNLVDGFIYGPHAEYIETGKGYVVKTDEQGNLLWEHRFTGDGSSKVSNDYFASVEITKQGNYILAGKTQSYGKKNELNNDVLVVEYTAQGAVSWIKAYDHRDSDSDNFAMSIALSANGGYAVVGSAHNPAPNYDDIFFLKLTVNGDIE